MFWFFAGPIAHVVKGEAERLEKVAKEDLAWEEMIGDVIAAGIMRKQQTGEPLTESQQAVLDAATR